jgi:hypothetical protein
VGLAFGAGFTFSSGVLKLVGKALSTALASGLRLEDFQQARAGVGAVVESRTSAP